ncbi:hypothetical protein BC332_27557 [Capsicum chinense]|nr:hypothetical protein BC332_27557 [Capsicum chinense]
MSVVNLKGVVFSIELDMIPRSHAPELRATVGLRISAHSGQSYDHFSWGYTPWQEYDTSPQREVSSLGGRDIGLYVVNVLIRYGSTFPWVQDPKFAENRSKHKNEPVTKKKLKKVAAFRSKKSGLKAASKKKFDDSDRPRFPKQKKAPISLAHFQIVEDDRYIHFPWAKITFEKLMSSWWQDFNIAKQFYSLSETSHALNVWMFECCSEHRTRIYNLQSKKFIGWVSFSEDFETFDPIIATSTSVARTLKRSVDEVQKSVSTITEEFGDFSTTIVKNPHKDSPALIDDDISTRDHPVHHVSGLYFETQKDAADKREIGVSEFEHHQQREIGVSPERHQHKSAPSSFTLPEGTSKLSLDGDDIKNYINKCHEDYDKESVNDIEETHDEEFNKQYIPDVQELLDEVGGTITDSIQAAVDTILFDLSTPSTTKSLDVGTSNKIIESQRALSDSQFSPDFSDAQIREREATKAKAPTKRKRKKSRMLRSLYITKYGSGSKDAGNSDKEETLNYAFNAKPTVELSTQEDYAESFVVAKNEDATTNIINGFCISAGLPWHMVDKIERTDWSTLEAYKGKLAQQISLVNEISFDVDYVQNIPQQAYDSLDCDVFVSAYAEILSEGQQVHSCGFDDRSQRAFYVSLMWYYGVEKANEGYTSDNDYPPWPRNSVL